MRPGSLQSHSGRTTLAEDDCRIAMPGISMKLLRLLPVVACASVLALAPVGASASDLEDALRELAGRYEQGTQRELRVAQRNGGKTLSEAVEQVRRQTNGRILSAETRMSGNREMHHIKVLTKDGKVKTHKIKGRKRGN